MEVLTMAEVNFWMMGGTIWRFDGWHHMEVYMEVYGWHHMEVWGRIRVGGSAAIH
jgi:hypothetical protein